MRVTTYETADELCYAAWQAEHKKQPHWKGGLRNCAFGLPIATEWCIDPYWAAGCMFSLLSGSYLSSTDYPKPNYASPAACLYGRDWQIDELCSRLGDLGDGCEVVIPLDGLVKTLSFRKSRSFYLDCDVSLLVCGVRQELTYMTFTLSTLLHLIACNMQLTTGTLTFHVSNFTGPEFAKLPSIAFQKLPLYRAGEKWDHRTGPSVFESVLRAEHSKVGLFSANQNLYGELCALAYERFTARDAQFLYSPAMERVRGYHRRLRQTGEVDTSGEAESAS